MFHFVLTKIRENASYLAPLLSAFVAFLSGFIVVQIWNEDELTKWNENDPSTGPWLDLGLTKIHWPTMKVLLLMGCSIVSSFVTILLVYLIFKYKNTPPGPAMPLEMVVTAPPLRQG